MQNPNYRLIKKFSIILLVNAAAWFPVLLTPFLNDDYQIIGYYFDKNPLNVFLERGVYYHYWRPIPDLIHGFILFIAGFHPTAFRIAGIIIYSITSLQIYRVFRVLGLEEKTSFLAALLFGVLPSHVLEAAWIADQLESLAATFLLLSFMNYIKAFPEDSVPQKAIKADSKYLLFSATWFAAAIMTKEVAYTGIFIPLIALVFRGRFDKNSVLRRLRDSFAGFLILAAVYTYRVVFIGGNPFEASHFSNISVFGIIKNFFTYIPLAFLPPEILESIYSLSNLFIYLSLLLIIIAFLALSAGRFRELSHPAKKIFLAGCIWYLIFIIPALPTLMRWYVYTASIGLILMASILLENLLNKNLFFIGIIVIILFLAVYDFRVMLDWKETGEKMDRALHSIEKIKEKVSSDTLYVWAVPDKFKRVPMMKLGIQQSINRALGKSSIDKFEILAPLHCELADENTKITIVEASDSLLKFQLFNGRFIPEGGYSTSLFRKEEFYSVNTRYQMKISTIPDMNGVPNSEAEVKFLKKSNADQLFYSGSEFRLLIHENY